MNISSETYAVVIAKAWKNPTFREKLRNHPHAALKECGCDIPPSTRIEVIQAAADTLHLVIPPSPANLNQLSEKELARVAAAAQCFAASCGYSKA